MIRLDGMTEATSWRGELGCDIGLPDINQATSTPQEWVEAGGSSATWPLGLVTRGQSNLMRVHWGEKRRERVMGTRQKEILRQCVYEQSMATVKYTEQTFPPR